MSFILATYHALKTQSVLYPKISSYFRIPYDLTALAGNAFSRHSYSFTDIVVAAAY